MHFLQYFTVFYSIMKRNLGTKQYILKIYIPKMQFLQKNVLLQILVVVSLYGLLALPLIRERGARKNAAHRKSETFTHTQKSRFLKKFA